MTWSHLRTLPGVFLVKIIFCILLVKLVYISVHVQHVWKRMTLCQWAWQETCDGYFAFFTSWNLEAVNLYLHSFFLKSEFYCSLVADSMLLLEFSSTSRVWRIAFLASFRLSEITNVSIADKGNLGKVSSVGGEWFNWGIEAILLQCKRWEISNNRPVRTGWNLTEARPRKWY